MLKQLVNMSRCEGWSFRAADISASARVLHQGEAVSISCLVVNNGLRLGTVYTRFLIADSYNRNNPFFDSNRDLSVSERSALRLVDIGIGERRDVATRWIVPAAMRSGHLDIRVEIWNPHQLYKGPRPFLFYDTGWVGGFEVISKSNSTPSSTVFISYSWDSDMHQSWVRELVEELRKFSIDAVFDQKDLLPGEEATRFMEREITESQITILICTDNYTRKADEREPGGVGFETVLSSHEYQVRTSEERARFIPIIRDNNRPKGRKLPKYLGSTIYVDMSNSNWRGRPMMDLVSSIKRKI